MEGLRNEGGIPRREVVGEEWKTEEGGRGRRRGLYKSRGGKRGLERKKRRGREDIGEREGAQVTTKR